MNTQSPTKRFNEQSITAKSNSRARLLEKIPVAEHRMKISGISTAVLEGGVHGGEKSPVILLHGPGESSLWWMRVIPRLVKTHRVVVPDLPGHGATRPADITVHSDHVLKWLRELVNHTAPHRPILVGHLLGGSIAARFAIDYGSSINRLILVNSLGIGKFRPSPAFAYRLMRFMINPTRKNYTRFLPQCMYKVENLRKQMGKNWEPFIMYNLECAIDPEQKAALKIMMRQLGIPKIPEEDLKKIAIPTALIWGRHDRANKLSIARKASKKYGWPLQIIEEARDDPKLEQPEAFVKALITTTPVNRIHIMSANPKQCIDMKTKKLNLKKADDKKYSQQPPENYERFFVPVIGRPLAEDLLSQSDLQKGERVLDVACGTGIVARTASQKVGKTGSVTGLDINPAMLEVARSTLHRDNPIKWINSNAEAMPFTDETFDAVFCQLGLQFMEDKPAALMEMRRVLVPGGRLFLNVPGPAGEIFTLFAQAMKRHISLRAAKFIDHVFSLHREAKLREQCSEARFRDIRVRVKNLQFYLPPPREFLWQYIHSTPLIELVSEANSQARRSLEREIIGKWQDFMEKDKTISYQQRILIVSARK